MTRKATADPEQRRTHRIATYLSASEKAATAKLGAEYAYLGEADVLRRGLALLVKQLHPELLPLLRKDLTNAL